MSAAAPGKGVRECKGLIEFAARNRIGQAGKGGEADSRQAKVKWIGGHTTDARISSNVLNVGVQVRGGNVIVVIVHAEIVGCASASIDPTSGGIQSLQTIATVQGRKRIYQRSRVARPIHAEVDVALRATATTAPSTGTTSAAEVHERQPGGAKVADQPQVDGAAATAPRRHAVTFCAH